MDNRTLEANASATPPTAPATPSIGYPQKGNPGTGTAASKGGVFWYYQVGEELRNVLLAAGLTPSTGDLTQIVTAIKTLIEARAGNYALDTGVANAYVVALSPAVTAYTNGMEVRVKIVNANTTACTLNAGGGAVSLVNDVGLALVSGDLPANCVISAVYDSTANKFIMTSLVPSQAMSQTQADARYAPIGLRSYLAGCTMSTAGASTTMSIAAGMAADSTNAVLMNLAAIAKTTAAWAVGTAQGGIDTGAIANATWYHFYLIRRPDTGVVDVVFSTNATTPVLPASYTQYRRIGSGLTNGSAQWVKFVQDGDLFTWDAAVLDVNATNPGNAAVSRTLSTPLGIVTHANLTIQVTIGTFGGYFYLSDLAITDAAPTNSAAPLGDVIATVANGLFSAGPVFIRTNASSQIRSRLGGGDASTVVRIATNGWMDSRGRNA